MSPKLMSDTKSQIQETQRTPTRMNDKKKKLNVSISFQATEKSKIKKISLKKQ